MGRRQARERGAQEADQTKNKKAHVHREREEMRPDKRDPPVSHHSLQGRVEENPGEPGGTEGIYGRKGRRTGVRKED